MFAVDHAATALLIKRRFPSVPMVPLLISVQAMELAWVALNYLGVERTTTAPTVNSIADIHLAYMPYSHSAGSWRSSSSGILRTSPSSSPRYRDRNAILPAVPSCL